MRVLIIDNNIDRDSWGSEEICRFVRQTPGVTLTVRRAPHDDLPGSPTAFDRVIVSGSKTPANDDAPWIDRLLSFIGRTVDEGKPLFGICYGHQMLNRAIGGKTTVHRAATSEHGWTKIELLDVKNAPLLKGMPREFYSFSSHYDEVRLLPQGMTLLAKSDACAIQACQVNGKPVYGIQFHPEKNLTDGEKSMKKWKKEGTPKTLLGFGESESLFDPKVGETLFRNFLSL